MKDQLGAVSQGASELGEKTSKMGVRLTVKLLATSLIGASLPNLYLREAHITKATRDRNRFLSILDEENKNANEKIDWIMIESEQKAGACRKSDRRNFAIVRSCMRKAKSSFGGDIGSFAI